MQASTTLTDVNSIAERLKQTREGKGLTQPRLAEIAKVSPGTIGNIESGIRKNPRELLAIAAALDVEPEWLKSGKGPMQRRQSDAAEDVPPSGGPSSPLQQLLARKSAFSERSQKTLETLLIAAEKNALTDEHWALLDELARRFIKDQRKGGK